MTSDNPFDDPDRTVLRPNPGGRRSTPSAPAARPEPSGEAAGAGRFDSAILGLVEERDAGVNPLVAAASNILSLVASLRSQVQNANVDALRRQVTQEIREFERRAASFGEDQAAIRAGRYALCATVDDLVLNTPWGANSAWAQHSMVGTFHNETYGGERFFKLLQKLEKDPGRNLHVLELMYLCTSLGFEGQYRVLPRGKSDHGDLRDGVYRLLRSIRGTFERELSPQWRGLDVGHKPLSSFVPIWVIGVAALALVCLIYLGFGTLLNSDSDEAVAALQDLPPRGPVVLARPEAPPLPPIPVVESGQLPRIKGFLQDEIRQDLVEVFEDPQTITVRVLSGMFASGSATVNGRYLPILGRIGQALEGEVGQVIAVGHTDAIPIRTVAFPSNWHLSMRRAEAVQTLLGPTLSDPSRLSADGRASNQPIDTNDTAAGRSRNRRIEIMLMKDGAVWQ